MKRPAPQPLIDSRPALAQQDIVYHPTTGPGIGRPPAKYTRAVHDVICDELKKGQRPQGACAKAGITMATYYEWIRRGKAEDPHLWEFAQDVEIAMGLAEAKAVETIVESFTTTNIDLRNPDNAKWFLERARPDGYSKQVKTLVDGQIKQFMERLEAALPAELFEQVIAVYLGQAAPGALPPGTTVTESQPPEDGIEDAETDEIE